ncbi:hypothetical protein B0H10DRAFT_2232387 [Mycena sp. CBHHK59/15]|nr:hypothetical protein B0H10DRAFT_2232387 [Mycena sp. CBHHK59/15]
MSQPDLLENGPPPSLFARAAPAQASINARIVAWSFVAPASRAATQSIRFIGYSIGPVPFSGQSAQGTGPAFAARAPQAWAMPQPVEIALDYCGCQHASSWCDQLTAARLLPSEEAQPRIAADFRVIFCLLMSHQP